MRRVASTGIVLSALLAWTVVSVAQNTGPKAPAQGQVPAIQVAQTGATGTVVGSGGAVAGGAALSTAALVTVAAVAVVAVAATASNSKTSNTTGTR
jgi:hypothetical protein